MSDAVYLTPTRLPDLNTEPMECRIYADAAIFLLNKHCFIRQAGLGEGNVLEVKVKVYTPDSQCARLCIVPEEKDITDVLVTNRIHPDVHITDLQAKNNSLYFRLSHNPFYLSDPEKDLNCIIYKPGVPEESL